MRSPCMAGRATSAAATALSTSDDTTPNTTCARQKLKAVPWSGRSLPRHQMLFELRSLA